MWVLYFRTTSYYVRTYVVPCMMARTVQYHLFALERAFLRALVSNSKLTGNIEIRCSASSNTSTTNLVFPVTGCCGGEVYFIAIIA
jgi:hypothetical protein